MSFVCHTFHIVFSTKNREPLIKNDFKESLYQYIGGIIRDKRGKLIEAGGKTDHIHLLAQLHQGVAHADMIRDIKSGSSRWVNEKKLCPVHFSWQNKYGSFSVSKSNEDAVRRYIQNQEAHHKKISFQEEFRAWLDNHGVTYDERYVWE